MLGEIGGLPQSEILHNWMEKIVWCDQKGTPKGQLWIKFKKKRIPHKSKTDYRFRQWENISKPVTDTDKIIINH